MGEDRTILFAGGGTGGHLYPGISVAQAIGAMDAGIRPVFLCTRRAIDATILTPTGYEFIEQPVVPLVRSVSGLLRFYKGWRETQEQVRRILAERNPVAVLGLGGYAAGVAVKAAGSRGIPAAILNPDVIPGKANQYLLKYVRAVCCQYEATLEHVPAGHRDKCRVTGCPVRREILALPEREEAMGRLELDPMLRTLVVTGASQGARTVNEAVVAALGTMKIQGWQVLHLSGTEHAAAVRASYRELKMPARVIDFTPAMADVWAAADLAVSRSGASSCAELAVCGIPSILMPYPFHNDMHQRANAKVLADAGGAALLDDEKDVKLNAPRLAPILGALMNDQNRRKAMGEAAKGLGKAEAAQEVARTLLGMIGT